MLYFNVEFFLLFGATALLYRFTSYRSLRLWILLLSSLIFYAWAGLFDTLIFIFVIAVTWFATWFGVLFPKRKRFWLVTGITVMVLHLFFWKYASWVSTEIQKVWPQFLGGKVLNLPLPVGISFFTLEGIAYLVDLGKSKTAWMNLREFLVFKSFFPKLVAGPITRAQQLVPQIRKLRKADLQDLSEGLFLFAIGFFKKLMIADVCAVYVDSVFASPQKFDRTTLGLGVLGYTVQIWADFSGYTDMGRGTARMLGFQLPENFLCPYLSRSPSEFWRRWHITLSQWIRDYIYIPLGGHRGSAVRTVLVLFTTMGISGLWHGANWTFLLWGLYHACLLLTERAIAEIGRQLPAVGRTLGEIGRVLQWPLVFFAVVLGWLIFRAPSVGELGSYLGAFFRPGTESLIGTNVVFGILACALFHLAFYSRLEKPADSVELAARNWLNNQIIRRKSRLVSWVVGCVAGLVAFALVAAPLFLRDPSRAKQFIYFQF